jgi:hypothetical protein
MNSRFILFYLIGFLLNQMNCRSKIDKRSKIKASGFTYNLDGSVPNKGSGGGNIYKAFLDDFPALQDEKLAFALFEIKPCGINLPHFHPRAAELIYVCLVFN